MTFGWSVADLLASSLNQFPDRLIVIQPMNIIFRYEGRPLCALQLHAMATRAISRIDLYGFHRLR